MDHLTAELVAECFPKDTSRQLYSLCKEFATDLIIEGYAGIYGILHAAVAVGNTNHVIKLLQNKMLNKMLDTMFYNKLIKLACEHGHIDIIKILLVDNRIDPFDVESDDDYMQCPIMLANENFHFDIVKLLLNDTRYNNLDRWYYEEYINDILYNASENGYINMVKFVVENYPFCIPKWNDIIIDKYKNNRFIDLNCAKDYLDILQITLSHPNFRLNTADVNNDNFYYNELNEASENDTELLRVLLLIPNIIVDEHEINHAVTNNNIENLKLLLAYDGINLDREYDTDPTRTSIYIAGTFNNIEMIKLLLTAGKDPSLNENEALLYALENNNLEISKLLMSDTRVINIMYNEEAKSFLEFAGVDISDQNLWLV